MKLSLKWLKDYLQHDLQAEEIANILTSLGLEVDSITTQGQNFEGVVVAEVMSVEKHPDAEKLNVAQVNDGHETLQVVCAATNCRAGLKTAFAKVGANLKDAEGKDFKIKKAKLRGIESNGMLCAKDELGLSDVDEPGIMELPKDLPLGMDLSSYYKDTILEISLTPNLGHCNSILGVARELSAYLDKPIVSSKIALNESQEKIEDFIKVDIQDAKKCLRYAARLVQGVKVAPSPDWMQQKLKAVGIRPVNNVVDITNYVFQELGQPLHAFDYDKIENKKIIVRSAFANEELLTLDDKKRVLTKEDLVIGDENKALAIAGVMGGKNSEVTESTQDVLLEAAYFLPSAVRRTSKTLGLSTDASKRFERGADFNAVLEALEKAAVLLSEIAGGQVAKGVIDLRPEEIKEKEISCRLSRVNQILGTALNLSDVEDVFRKLQFPFKIKDEVFAVTVPTYRVDIHEEIDLIEEVARLYGYDNINRQVPVYKGSVISNHPLFSFERRLREILVACGLQEYLNCDLIGPTLLNIVQASDNHLEEIKVLNPVSIEQSVLRTSLLPGLLNTVKYNYDHQNHSIRGFEIGRIHYKAQDKYEEQPVLALVMSGKADSHTWNSPEREFDFFDLKGVIENLLDLLRIENVQFKKQNLSSFHTSRQAGIFVGDLEIGSMGEIHPFIQNRLSVSERIYFAEFNIYDLIKVAKNDYKMKNIPCYPGSERDLTVTVKEDVSVQDLLDLIKQIPSEVLKSVTLLDIYRSEKLGSDLKNVTLHFVYRDDTKTISQEAVDKEHAKITEYITNKGGSLCN